MSPDSSELQRDVAVQREVARIALAGVDGFALAGSGAIHEHGMIDRPTEDVDLFTTSHDVVEFSAAVDQVTEQLRGSGFAVDQTRRAAQFARLHVATSDGRQLDVDLGVAWRQDDSVRLDVGPVLSLADAVGNKVSALYSRGEPRDISTSTPSADRVGSPTSSWSLRPPNVTLVSRSACSPSSSPASAG